MKARESRRQTVLKQMARHILEVGLRGSSLRPLAAAAGTSDRMLLYYFADKNELLRATLGLLAEQLLKLLDDSLSGAEEPFDKLLPRISKLMLSPSIELYMKLWLELVSLAARGEEPFQTIAGQLYDGFLAWIVARLEVEREEERVATAALLLGAVEGLVLVNAIGRGEIMETALQRGMLQAKEHSIIN